MQSTRHPKPDTRHTSASERTYSVAQRAIQKEFIDAYNFASEQISFDGAALDPIFDFDALSFLSLTLSNLPSLNVQFHDFRHDIGLATSQVVVNLPGRGMRTMFAGAMLGEFLHDGSEVATLMQAVNLSRARALRIGLRAVNFDPLKAHREYQKSGQIVELEFPAKLPRDKEREEIHVLGFALGLIKRAPGLGDRSGYERAIGTFFPGRNSTVQLTDPEHTQFLTILRAWSRARAVAAKAA
jgi:hypothetical protein